MHKNSKTNSVKKDSLRKKNQYPYLKKDLNTKRRQDYLDNTEYIDGVKDVKGNMVIRGLTDDEKSFLNQFNKEYYGASFEKDDNLNLFKNKVDDNTIKRVKKDLSTVRNTLKTTTSNQKILSYTEEIKEIIEHLEEIYPKKTLTDANNARNRCLINYGRASNQFDIVTLDDANINSIKDTNPEIMYILNNMDIDYDNEEDLQAVYEMLLEMIDLD